MKGEGEGEGASASEGIRGRRGHTGPIRGWARAGGEGQQAYYLAKPQT